MEHVSGRQTGKRILYATTQPVVDWRQLQRWGIDRSRLPDNTNLLHYTPTLWEEYRWQIILIAAALVAQTLAILH